MPTDLPYTTYVAILLLAFISVFTTILGTVLAIYFSKSERAIVLGIGFSVGFMLLISLFELVPEALGNAGMALTIAAVGLGMLIVAALHWIIPHTHLAEEKGIFNQTLIRSAYLVAFGLILHDVPEGFAMANAYIASPSLGILVAVAIALHNIPEEFALAVPLVMTRKRRLLFKAALLSA